MQKYTLKKLILFVAILLTFTSMLAVYIVFFPQYMHGDDNYEYLIIISDNSYRQIASELKERSLIKNEAFFIGSLSIMNASVVPGSYKLSRKESMYSLIKALENPEEVWIYKNNPNSIFELAEETALEIGWNDSQKENFVSFYISSMWDNYHEKIAGIFAERLDWNSYEKNLFLERNDWYIEEGLENLILLLPLSPILVPNTDRSQDVAGVAVSKIDSANFVINEGAELLLSGYIRKKVELLPDIIPVAPRDVNIETSEGKINLIFTTTYLNIGRGPLELIADPKTLGVEDDIKRNVMQKIYHTDGKFREVVVGNFLWHQSHLHYHFNDFIDYVLEPFNIYEPITNSQSKIAKKATFCIRDVSKIVDGVEIGNAKEEASYRVCGKEIQGVTVGWGDSYFSNYPGQNIDISGLPEGNYRLTFTADPKNKLNEENEDNNISSAVLYMNPSKEIVNILERTPDINIEIDDVYKEDIQFFSGGKKI